MKKTRIEKLESFLNSCGFKAEAGYKFHKPFGVESERPESVRVIDLSDSKFFPGGTLVWLEWSAEKGADTGLRDGRMADGYMVRIVDGNGESHTEACSEARKLLIRVLKRSGYTW